MVKVVLHRLDDALRGGAIGRCFCSVRGRLPAFGSRRTRRRRRAVREARGPRHAAALETDQVVLRLEVLTPQPRIQALGRVSALLALLPPAAISETHHFDVLDAWPTAADSVRRPRCQAPRQRIQSGTT